MSDYKKGVTQIGTMVSIVAGATPVTLYALSAGRTCRIKKLHAFNGNVANALLEIGTGLAPFVRALPRIFINTGMDLEMDEDMFVGLEFTASITAQADVGAVAPNDIQMIMEVEEFQGPTG